MATKKPQVDVTKVPVQQGVDAESTYVAAQTANPDKQWMDDTAKAWDARKSAEKENDVVKVEGQAVINLADATGAVGEKTGAALIVADTANSEDAAVVVKKKDDDSHDKGGYIWGGLGVLGLIGIAAAGGGGGDSAPAPPRCSLMGW